MLMVQGLDLGFTVGSSGSGLGVIEFRLRG